MTPRMIVLLLALTLSIGCDQKQATADEAPGAEPGASQQAAPQQDGEEASAKEEADDTEDAPQAATPDGIVLSKDGLSNVKGLQAPLAKPGLAQAFPGFTIKTDEIHVGEGFTEERFVISKDGEQALLIAPGNTDKELIQSVDVLSGHITTDFGAAVGGDFAAAIKRFPDIYCDTSDEREQDAGKVLCRSEKEERFVFIVSDEKSNQKKCDDPGNCVYDVSTMKQNKIEEIRWSLPSRGPFED